MKLAKLLRASVALMLIGRGRVSVTACDFVTLTVSVELAAEETKTEVGREVEDSAIGIAGRVDLTESASSHGIVSFLPP